jgi:hypothetical protein
MADVRVIAARPHLAASAENAAVRAHLAARMRGLGMAVREVRFTPPAMSAARLAMWSGKQDFAPTFTNVIGVLPGKDRSLPAVLLMAHHDTVGGSPGAADDTAGVAALLETVRAVRAEGPPARDLIVLLTDGEETGLDGAHQFFTADPQRGAVGAVINVEARGGGGRTTLFETSADNGAAITRAASSIARPGGSSLAVFIYKVLPNDTDLTEALTGPYTAYNFAFIGRPQLYHSPKATPDALDQGALQDMGAQVLDLTRDLLRAEPLPGRAADVVFFDAFGFALVTYPAWAGWVMLALAAVGLGLAARRGGGWRDGLGGAGRMLALFVLLDLISFWQAAWTSRDALAVSGHALMAIISFTGAYYLAASLVFPRDADASPDHDAHFFRVRRIVIGVLLVLLAAQLAYYASVPSLALLIVSHRFS